MNSSSSGALEALSAELVAAVAAAAPSVVYVDAHPRRDASGIAWDAHHIVTVDHAVERDDEIELVLANGRVSAQLVGRDPSTDVALLRTESELVPLPRDDGATLAMGQLVLALARDEDGAPAASLGIVSALDGPWRTWRGGDVERFVRPGLSVGTGFSGGALVAASGTLIGMNTWGLSRRTPLTVPVETLARVVGALQHGGRIARAYLGVALQAVRLPQSLRSASGLGQESGAIVVDVAPDGPAERAGVTLGDVVIALAGRSLEDGDDLQRILAGAAIGTTHPLRILRAGEARELPVTIGERPRDDA